MGKTFDLYNKAKKIIPGGTQLLSKRPELYLPGLWPAYFKEAKGCEVYDLDDNRYIDMSYMGIGSCVLGYADKDVNKAVKAGIDKGSMTTLNCSEDVELAQLLCEIHPWAKMVRFARTGGEAMAVAVRIARASVGKDLILFCGYHGWHDWYLSANLGRGKSLDGHLLPGLSPSGVPRGLKQTAVPFSYNDIKGFLKLINKYKGRIAAVVMEPIRTHYPDKGFLETIRDVTREEKIVLVFDEVTSGWRLTVGGAHLNFNVYPDIAVFAKALSNGYPMAAVIGRKEIMKNAQETFISSTYWTERVGPLAALATIKKLRDNNVPKQLVRVGKNIQLGWEKIAKKNNLRITISGIYPLSHIVFNYKDHLVLKTLFTQLMLEENFLATTAVYVSFAHKNKHIVRYLAAADRAFGIIAKAIESGRPKRYLKGPVCQSGFKRLT